MIASRSDVRRIAAAIVAAGAVLACASCAAGQNAATAEEVPSIDGTNATVGNIQLEGVSIQAPSDSSYAAGSKVPLSLAIVNNGASADTLTAVTSPAFSSWGIADTTAATAATQPTPTSIPPGTSLRLGLQNPGGSATSSAKTLVLSSLAKTSSPLFPGSSVAITFKFAKAGSTTLTVPVQLTTTPNSASVSAPSQPA